jgi:hypothetical protein
MAITCALGRLNGTRHRQLAHRKEHPAIKTGANAKAFLKTPLQKIKIGIF